MHGLAPAPLPIALRSSASDVERMRRVLRALRPCPAVPSRWLGERWERCLGAPVTLRPSLPSMLSPSELRAGLSDRCLSAVFAYPRGPAVLCLIDRPLAWGLADRALARAPSSPLARTLDAATEGALAALVARVAVAASHPSAPPVLRGVTDQLDDALEALGVAPGHSPRALFAWPWSVTTRELSGTATLVLDPDALPLPSHVTPPLDLDRFDELLVPAALIGGRAVLPAATVAGIAVGDVVAMDGLSRRGGALHGRASLALGTDLGRWIHLDVGATPEGELVLTCTGGAEPPRSLVVSEEKPADGAVAVKPEALASLGVEVVVELGRAEFPLGEIARWSVGEVLRFPARVGDVATLRAGSKVVARGELVDVDGALGLRVTEVL